MNGDITLIRFIEELAANSWPAHIQQRLGTWRLRANMNVTRRANSVYTNGAYPEHGEWLDVVEDFYRRQALAPCFCVSEASPIELEGILDSRGYSKIFECYVMIASCNKVLEQTRESDRFICELAGEASREWVDDFMRFEGYSSDRYQGYRHIFSAMPPQKAFASLYDQGILIACGTVVAERGWAGLSNIVVDQEHRGKGAASVLLHSLANWALSKGADQLYLQVLKENALALSLYHKLGFTPLFEYHYRLLEENKRPLQI
ncbi:GNAT family N-acetyltransferase [bacterium BFN5]|nr:GNAT family N-acetyltransferase [bacterium BFN5]